MLLVCFLLSQISVLKGLIQKDEASSFSNKEKLKRRTILIKYWMGRYFSLPKIIKWNPIGDLIEIWGHFGLFIIGLEFLLLELGSVFYTSFIEGSGLGLNPYCQNDAQKYSVFYVIDALLLFLLNMDLVVIQIAFHAFFSILVLIHCIRQKQKWQKYDFGSDVVSVTDLGIINDSHMVLCQYFDQLEVISLDDKTNTRTSVSQININDHVEVRKFYSEHKIVVVTQSQLSGSPNHGSPIQGQSPIQGPSPILGPATFSTSASPITNSTQMQGTNPSSMMTVTTLQIPSLHVVHQSNRILEVNKHFILNDSQPNLAIFDSDRTQNNTRIKIFNLLNFQEQHKKFELTQAFCINEYFESEQIKLFMEIEEFDTADMQSRKSNHVIKVQNKTIWDIDTSKKKAQELIENAPEIFCIQKINNRVLAMCGSWRIIMYDMPTKVKVRRIDAFHTNYSLMPIQNQQDAYLALPSNAMKSKKNAYLMKNKEKSQYLCLDHFMLDTSFISSAIYWSSNNSVSLVIGNTLYINKNKYFYKEQKDALDFSICVTE